jgi:hypothetical protein
MFSTVGIPVPSGRGGCQTAGEFEASAIGFAKDDKLVKISARNLFTQCPETLFALNLYSDTQSTRSFSPLEVKSILQRIPGFQS